MTSVKHISWQGGNTMDFKNFAKDAIGNVKDNAVSKIDGNILNLFLKQQLLLAMLKLMK